MEWVYESICYEILLRSGDERESILACSGLAFVGILYSPPQPWKQPNESTCIDYGLHLRMRKLRLYFTSNEMSSNGLSRP